MPAALPGHAPITGSLTRSQHKPLHASQQHSWQCTTVHSEQPANQVHAANATCLPVAAPQIEGMSETLKTATAAPAMSVHESKMIASNDKFVRSEYEQQQLVVKEQDQHLEDIEQAVTRLGRVGLDIHKVGGRTAGQLL